MSNSAKALLLIAFCTALGYLSGRYPLGMPRIQTCQELVLSDIIARRKYEAELTQVIGSDFLTELSTTSEKK